MSPSCCRFSLVDISDVFYYFRLGGEEGGGYGATGMGRGVGFLIENPTRGGGGLPREGGE